MVTLEHKPDVGPAVPRGLHAIGGLAGLALAVCFFLPAVQACNKPTYPFEVPAASGPYVLGAITAVIALLAIVRHVPGWLRIVHLVVLAAHTFVLGYGVHVEALDMHERVRPISLLLLASFWPLALLTLRAYLPGRSGAWRTARATAGSGALMLVWFVPFVRGALYGLWISIAAAAVLLVVGVLEEVTLIRTRSRVPRPSVF